MLTNAGSGYMDNPLRQNLFRAGHAHAGVLLILSLVILKYVDDTFYSEKIKSLIRVGVPICAILILAAFFFSVLSPDATAPNGYINLAYIGFAILAITFFALGIGLVRENKKVEGQV